MALNGEKRNKLHFKVHKQQKYCKNQKGLKGGKNEN